MFLITQTTNSSFVATDEGRDYVSLEEAKAAAVEGALRIASDEVRNGQATCCVEVVLTDRDGQMQHRMMVALSTAPIFYEAQN